MSKSDVLKENQKVCTNNKLRLCDIQHNKIASYLPGITFPLYWETEPIVFTLSYLNLR